ncbi:hypothetical protein DPMN_137933 [Dreissena polymorpha]|uniref:Uncharacterized protein n=1 Tax=Dreissena polymorpha TaxID=45954 RepID=A0A9D4G2T3_DREPO|nr:hypothetical protein DPMN_137933 [Dreissena polymorpha]
MLWTKLWTEEQTDGTNYYIHYEHFFDVDKNKLSRWREDIHDQPDGTKISTLFDPALTLGGIIIPTVSPSLHVTDSGQVLVCGEWSGTIIQRLTEVVTVVAKKDDMKIPTCVYYSKHTEILVVGMLGGDILVFSTR